MFITNGTANTNTAWTQTTANPTMGTSNIVFVQNSGTGTYTAGTGLTLTGNAFSLTSPVALNLGGTNSALSGSNGSIVYNNGTSLVNSTVGTSGYYLTSGGAGAPTWSNPATSMVQSISFGTTGLTPSTATTGAVTVAGTLAVANGGTGLTTAPTNGQIDIGSTGVGFVRTTITGSTYLTVTNGAGSITLTNAGVTTWGGGTTGLTPSAATSGAVTLAGTLIVGNGGTGATTLGANGVLLGNGTSAVSATAVGTTGQVLIGNTAAAPTWSALSGLAVTSLTGTANQITASASTGAVTLSTPATFIAPGTIASTTTMTAGTTLTVTGNTANSFLYSGTAGLVTTTAAPTNGQLLIGSTGAAPVAAALAVSGTSIYVTNGAGSITLAGPKFYSEFTTAPVNAPTATASQSVAIGTGTSASIYGTIVTGNGQFATAGDAQGVSAVYRMISTTNATSEMFLDGAGAAQRLVLPNNSAWTFQIKVVARRTDATGTYGSWIFTGLIYRDATAATTTLSGLSKTTIARIGGVVGASDPIVTADTTNGSLKITGTGTTGDTIRWVAMADLVQVTN